MKPVVRTDVGFAGKIISIYAIVKEKGLFSFCSNKPDVLLEVVVLAVWTNLRQRDSLIGKMLIPVDDEAVGLVFVNSSFTEVFPTVVFTVIGKRN